MAIANHKPGGEVDAWCTSCRADRLHRIIAVVNGQPKKVECLSCKGHHIFRPTQAQKDAAAAHKRASKGTTSVVSRASRPTASSTPRKREDDLVATWEKAVAGQPFESFKPYRIDRTFAKGDLVRHSKFGDGVVSTILDANKCEILFREGFKTLAQSVQAS
ncbi:MAG: hypothetical protein HYV09_28145 [Deltaproteobacteria bacterium]|nr:hypothetical protein [Deltaproteobacteria bacterium]